MVSQAESISAWKMFLDWPSMQAAFMIGRYFVARSSAILRTMAARVVQGVSDQILWAFIAASMAIFTSFSPTLWKVASTCL